MADQKIRPSKYNGELNVATARKRYSKKWKNKKWKWEDLLNECSRTQRTKETISEYLKLSREEQADIKDVGGFVGGYLSGGVRKTQNVMFRTLATLDIDHATEDTQIWEEFTQNYNFAAILYSTHKHTKANPRFRLVIPFSREVTPTEYEPICRRIGEAIGLNYLDVTTYQLPRLFYWPSTSKDGDFVFEWQDGPACNPDAILNTYSNYKDVSEWPTSDREGELISHEIKKAGDPLEKPGLIGAFCRAYTIEDVIDKFLSDVYDHTATEGRYTFKKGSVAGGLVCYEGKFAYSHHDTDPVSRQLCNAFDLVRIHKFGAHDIGNAQADITKKPSFEMMQDFAKEDAEVCALLESEMFAGTTDEGGSEEGIPEEYSKHYAVDKRGKMEDCPYNRKRIMFVDKHFRAIKYDLFSQRDIITDPDSPFIGTHGEAVDDTALSLMADYVTEKYLKTSLNALTDKMLLPTSVEPRGSKPGRGFNPVKLYIEGQVWDNVPRIETVLTRYLGAEDTPLNRAISRKWFVGAVARVYNPGCKFDYCLVLQGEQGTGKSTFAECVAGKWLGSLSLSASDKEQCEVLTESWIVEIPELKGMRRAESDRVKDLISRQSDDFRAAYARKRTKNKRHCVFIASTNEDNFLKDTTGNRRFWIVQVKGGGNVYEWKQQLNDEVPQLWAEAKHYFDNGEMTYLSKELEEQAKIMQSRFTEIENDPFTDYLLEWLNILIPATWDKWGDQAKRAFYANHVEQGIDEVGTQHRDKITVYEIKTECPYTEIGKYNDAQIRATLKHLGWKWEQNQKRIAGKRYRYFSRPESEILKRAQDNEKLIPD